MSTLYHLNANAVISLRVFAFLPLQSRSTPTDRVKGHILKIQHHFFFIFAN